MSNTNFISGNTPLAYAGVAAKTPPNIFKYPRSPNTSDSVGYALGDLWLRSPANTPELWALISLIEYTAIWVKLYPSTATGIEFVTDAGTANPLAGILNVLGDGVGINTSATGNTITIHADSDVAEIYRTDLGDAAPSSGVLRVAGGVNINTIGSGNIVTIALNDDVSLSGTLTVDGNATFNSDVTITSLPDGVVQTTSGLLSSSSGTNGQVLIGATAGAPAWANITSLGATVSITNGANSINLETAAGGGTVIISQFTSSGTWTKNASTQYVEVYGICGGGGGASGEVPASPTSGMGGGGGGTWGSFYIEGPAFCFGSSQAITVGAGGMGGAAVSGTSGVPANIGGNGGGSIFGEMTLPIVGFNPSALRSGGGNGDAVLAGFNGQMVTDKTRLDTTATGTFFPGYGGGWPNLPSGKNGQTGVNRGILAASDFNSQYTYSSLLMGGGGGGGAASDPVTAYSGGNGGAVIAPTGTILVSPGLGGSASSTIDGSDGADGLQGVGVFSAGAGGGGGGNQQSFTRGGNGGNGGFPGGGGGGGGCANTSPPIAVYTSGAGGNGAGGIVIVIEYL